MQDQCRDIVYTHIIWNLTPWSINEYRSASKLSKLCYGIKFIGALTVLGQTFKTQVPGGFGNLSEITGIYLTKSLAMHRAKILARLAWTASKCFHDLTHQPWAILDFKFPWICNDLIQKSFRTFLNPHSGGCLSHSVGRPAVARPSACLSAPGCNATGRTGLHWLRPNAVVRPPGKPVKLQWTVNVNLIMFLFDLICTWLILNMLKKQLVLSAKGSWKHVDTKQAEDVTAIGERLHIRVDNNSQESAKIQEGT